MAGFLFGGGKCRYAFGIGKLAQLLALDIAIAVQQNAKRQKPGFVAVCLKVIKNVKLRRIERIIHRHFCQKHTYQIAPVGRNADNFDIRQPPRRFVKKRHFFHARRAPCRPEVNQYIAAARVYLRQRYITAPDIGKLRAHNVKSGRFVIFVVMPAAVLLPQKSGGDKTGGGAQYRNGDNVSVIRFCGFFNGRRYDCDNRATQYTKAAALRQESRFGANAPTNAHNAQAPAVCLSCREW